MRAHPVSSAVAGMTDQSTPTITLLTSHTHISRTLQDMNIAPHHHDFSAVHAAMWRYVDASILLSRSAW